MRWKILILGMMGCSVVGVLLNVLFLLSLEESPPLPPRRCPPQGLLEGEPPSLRIIFGSSLLRGRCPLLMVNRETGEIIESPHGYLEAGRPYVQTHDLTLATLNPLEEGLGGPSYSLHMEGFFEWENTLLFYEVTKDCDGLVVDIGANIGYYTIISASQGCRVLSIEPNPSLIPIIASSAVANGVSERITLLSAGVGARTESICYSTRETCPGCLSQISCGEGAESITLISLSDLLDEDVLFMKIDVDGLEIQALIGILPLLRRREVRIIFVELNPHWWSRGGRPDARKEGLEVLDELFSMGYTPHKHNRMDGPPWEYSDLREKVEGYEGEYGFEVVWSLEG